MVIKGQISAEDNVINGCLFENYNIPTVKKIQIPLKDDSGVPNGNILSITVDGTMHKTITKALAQGYTITTEKGKIFPNSI